MFGKMVSGADGLYPNKLPVTAVYVMNNDMLPNFEAHEVRISTVLSDMSKELRTGCASWKRARTS